MDIVFLRTYNLGGEDHWVVNPIHLQASKHSQIILLSAGWGSAKYTVLSCYKFITNSLFLDCFPMSSGSVEPMIIWLGGRLLNTEPNPLDRLDTILNLWNSNSKTIGNEWAHI